MSHKIAVEVVYALPEKQYLQRVTLEEYRKTKYEDLRVRVPKGRKEEIKAFVATTGKSLNSFINEAIDEKIEREKK